MERDRNKASNLMPPLLKLSSEHPALLQAFVIPTLVKNVPHTRTLQITLEHKMSVVILRLLARDLRPLSTCPSGSPRQKTRGGRVRCGH